MKIGDFVEWRDQINYPGLSGIVTRTRHQSVGAINRGNSPEIFVHWLNFPKDYMVGEGWETETNVRIISAITKDIR
jgi:hypothetical protein